MGFGFGQRRGGRLPVERTSFVGREGEVALVRDGLARVRLVTLVGPGGVGKSRTALHAADALRTQFPDGTWLVELSALHDPELLPATLAAVFELPQQPGMEPLDAVVAHLQDRRLLIVLDTCEHLLDACAMLSDILLRETRGVSVLATSRQPLDVPGEHCVQIAPLAPADARELFVQRAAAVVTGFTATDANRDHLSALVARLDGIPLALELAAVRLRSVPLAACAARLDDRFGVLTAERRSSLTRHQTLRAAIAWSYELCTEPERLLWARLSVFAGSFELTAAERVCAGGELPGARVVETLIGLVDKSVVQRTGEEGQRYRLLDTIREYGADRLAETGGADAVRDRHFAYHRELGQRFWDELLTSTQVELHRSVRAQIADVQAALAHAYAGRSQAGQGLWLAAQLGPYWRATGTLAQGRFWVDKGLALLPGDCPERAWGLFMTGVFAVWTADLVTALDRLGQAQEVARRVGEDRVELFSEAYLGALRALCGEVDEGLAALELAYQRMVATGDTLGMAVVHYEGALARAVLGDLAGALELCEKGLVHLENTGDRQFLGSTLVVQGVIRWLAGQYEDSAAPLREGLAAAGEIGEVLVAALACLGLAWHAAREERYVRAAWLLGYAENARRLNGDPVSMLPSLLAQQESVHEAARAGLGGERFAHWHAVGARMSGTEILEAVRNDTDGEPRQEPADAASDAQAGAELSPREREVATMVAQGLSNRQIAEKLVISKRTADAHVLHIMSKLGLSSRRQVPPAHELGDPS
ncbi:LuxR family transcriptional regulator [Solihabitans fulvus]|uniref:LuxR family transcriptional regulator n=1 Tax=Solihabitans fulvus TaxID=1892852 RepID=A0A5B2XFI8_9PSEU|nr:LuxR C-terminal-related transcriptional regulator [Solihabitans fulvus]KAA2262598.1 LuxR family transcriptional regulator [Solihabitans fulvus]